MFTIPPIMIADQTTPSLFTIAKEVAREFNLNVNVLFGTCRMRIITDARKVYFYLAHKYTSYSPAEIAESMNRKRSTIYYSIDSIEALKNQDKKIASVINNVSNILDNE